MMLHGVSLVLLLFVFLCCSCNQKNELLIIKKRLEKIHSIDDSNRDKLQFLFSNKEKYSDEYFSKKITQVEKKDIKNFLYVEKIVRKYGWIGVDSIGIRANEAIFLVVQHCPDGLSKRTDLNYFLNELKESIDRKQTNKKFYPYLYDRLKMQEGKKQLFGTQFITDDNGGASLYPIENEKNLNDRRMEYGLSPIESYVKKMFNLQYVYKDSL